MAELLDIHVDDPIINHDAKVVIVRIRIDYKGNTFEALGSAKYYAAMEEPDTEYAIMEAQSMALERVKKLAGIK